ncbi:MAG: hypothetical protein PHO02_07205 [Candidatus Nanoarchaeia archaeon]|nr:hypothetical protein [Candidatus Nanoarchaeia archaeon]
MALKKAAAGLALAGILSASAPAKADMFDTIPDYSYVNNTAYVEAHRQETPAEAFERVLEPAENTGILEAPFMPRVDLFPSQDITIPAREITVEDYLDENNIDYTSQFTTNWWEYPINIAGSYVLTVAWHELGHYTLANLLGANDVEMHMFDGECSGGSVACVRYRRESCEDRFCRNIVRDVGQLQETIIAAAGMGFTTMGNVALTSLLKNDALPDWSRSFAATTSLMMMADRHKYIWSSAIQHWARMDMGGSDIEHIMRINFSSSEAKDAAYGVLVAASAIELALRWEEIWYLMNTIARRQVEVPEGLGIMPGLYNYGSTLMLGASGEF